MNTGFTDERTAPGLVRLAERHAQGQSFHALFREGMTLVDETATYLDGEGRGAAEMLGKSAATLYAAESMRLTTRLMHLASWLLLQRAAIQGEMTAEQVATEKAKVRLEGGSASMDSRSYAELPERFVTLVERTDRLEGRVRRLDRDLSPAGALDDRPARNAVAEQIDLLRTAFSF
jgi:regulator of CtrA degradation